MNKIKIIFFDWNKTLSNNIFWQQLGEEDNRLYGKLLDIEKVLFDQKYDLINKWMLGKIGGEDICEFVGKKTKINKEVLFEELIISCQKMTYVNEQVESLLKKLKNKGFRLVIATDNMDVFSRFTAPVINSNFLFDKIINSSEVGCFKYDCIGDKLPFFDNYLKSNKLKYDQVVLIDDSIDKKGNFGRLGFKIININNPKELISVMNDWCKD